MNSGDELSEWRNAFWELLGIESDDGTPDEMRCHVSKFRKRINELQQYERDLSVAVMERNEAQCHLLEAEDIIHTLVDERVITRTVQRYMCMSENGLQKTLQMQVEFANQDRVELLKLRKMKDALLRYATARKKCNEAVERWASGDAPDNIITETDNEALALEEALRAALEER
jgi:hypothetical protein